MLITPRFVFLQMPRTGSTFCEKVIMSVVPNAQNYVGGFGSKHNYRESIPHDYKNLPVIGVKRDPVELLDSWGCIGIWQTLHIDIPQEKINRHIGFEEWYDLVKEQFNVDTGLVRAVYTIMFAPINEVRFLDFANLNQSLYDFLREYGYENKDILKWPRVNTNKKREPSIPPYMMAEIVRAEA